MGALHAGHQSLITKARELSDEVVVSVFVNPLQFEDKTDLAKYPKTPEQDARLAQAAGVTNLWTPDYETIYPTETKKLSAGELGSKFEGVHRLGHFDGVLTVVNRLFEMVKPRYAIFGEKDFQQLFLIRQFAHIKFPNTQIISGETVRNKNGIALSSRNSRLTSDELEIARVLPRTRERAQSENSVSVRTLKALLQSELNGQPGFTLDYAEVVDPTTLLPVSDDFQGSVQVLLAGWIGSIRLIDNFAFIVKGQI